MATNSYQNYEKYHVPMDTTCDESLKYVVNGRFPSDPNYKKDNKSSSSFSRNYSYKNCSTSSSYKNKNSYMFSKNNKNF